MNGILANEKTYIISSVADAKVIIVGAGKHCEKILAYLAEKNIQVSEIFDNDEKKQGTCLNEIKITKPYKAEGKTAYIITPRDGLVRDGLRAQLKAMGIKAEDILDYDMAVYKYMENLPESKYQNWLDEEFSEIFGYRMDWNKPVTYNEKLNWEKVHVRSALRTKVVDKYRVREYIKDKLGEEYLNELYGVYDDASEIDFDKLPQQFVLKLNNGSSRNIVVKDKNTLDIAKTRAQLNRWKKINHAYTCLEMQYKDVPPKIICEKFIPGMAESLYDYQFYCFHGKPKYIWCIKASHKENCQASFYDTDWKKQEFTFGYPGDPELAPRPKQLEKMLKISEILSADFEHVRVDLYELPDGCILFGELTLTSWGGFHKFVPLKYDFVWGGLI